MPTLPSDPQSVSMARVDWTVENGKVTQTIHNKYRKTWTDTRSGVSNPAWRKLVKSHRNATTGYTCSFKKYFPKGVQGSGTVVGYDNSLNHIRERAFDGILRSDWGDVNVPSGFSTAKADLNARQQFVSKYRKRRTQFQSGVFFGELMETVAMIANPAKALRQGLDSYYRYVKKRVRHRMDHRTRRRIIRDSWLEYSLGVGPLVNDVADAAKLGTANPYAVFMPIQGQFKDEQEADSERLRYSYGHTAVWYYDVTKGSCTVKYKGAIGAQNSPPSFPEQLGISWSNVFPTIWEIIPNSFLVDYFSNVGKVIEGISTGVIKLAWGCKTTWNERIRSIESVELDRAWLDSFIVAPGGYTYGYATGGGPVGSAVFYDRKAIGGVSVGIGDLSFKLPGSGTKWLNIAALTRMV